MRRRIFLKYIFATLALGLAANILVLGVYYQFRRAEMVGRAAAEIATVANKLGPAMARAAAEGDSAAGRQLMGVFSAYPYVICADFLVSSAGPAFSFPAIGCARMQRQGVDFAFDLPPAGPNAALAVRFNADLLRGDLNREFLVLGALSAIGGLALILGGALAFFWFINRPLARLVEAIDHFEQTGAGKKVGHVSDDEIGAVAASYNQMLDRELQRIGEIRDAHGQIVDSITYATRIQRGLLPPKERLARALGEVAVVWRPRDLVGGDIYWLHEDGDVTTLFVIDCTGHGVPGGFMTMLVVASLQRIFARRTPGPAEALRQLDDLTRRLLNQDGPSPASNDGMDAAAVRVDFAAGKAVFAGARLSLMVAQDGRVRRIKGDRVSIGYPSTNPLPQLAETEIALDGATFLLVTDGVTDQLGGTRRIALGYKRLAEFAQADPGANLESFVDGLRQGFEAYAAGEFVLDDLTIIAFRPRPAQSSEAS